jgi:hypothetical protein
MASKDKKPGGVLVWLTGALVLIGAAQTVLMIVH